MWTSAYNIYGLHGRRIPVLDDQVQSERGDRGKRNSVLTPDGMGQVVGHRPKFDRDDAEQSIYFVGEDGAVTKVDVVGRNKPPDLMFMPTPWKCGAPSMAARRCAPVFFPRGQDDRRGRVGPH